MHPDDERLLKSKTASREDGTLKCPCGAEVIEPGKKMPGNVGQVQSGSSVRYMHKYLSTCLEGHDVNWTAT